MRSIVTVSGPSDAGPGERELMLSRAHEALAGVEASDITRVDVPPKGVAAAENDTLLRAPVQVIVPALQSASLFGDRTGLLIVDAQWLLKAEAEVIAELVTLVDGDAVTAVFVSAGAIPAPLGKTLKNAGDVLSVKRLNERGAAEWLSAEARARGARLRGDAVEALIQRFGTDVASVGQALDQLVASGEEITGDLVRTRFVNRPDEPSWLYMDAVAKGSSGGALRRLADFLQHSHPLILLAVINNDLRRRCLAAGADDYESFADRDGGRHNFAMEKVWKQRNRVKGEDLRRALDAVARADLQLKTAPEATHRVTLERLTVALCRWYGGRVSGSTGR